MQILTFSSWNTYCMVRKRYTAKFFTLLNLESIFWVAMSGKILHQRPKKGKLFFAKASKFMKKRKDKHFHQQYKPDFTLSILTILIETGPPWHPQDASQRLNFLDGSYCTMQCGQWAHLCPRFNLLSIQGSVQWPINSCR